MKSTSTIAQKITIGEKLHWKGQIPLIEVERIVKEKLTKN